MEPARTPIVAAPQKVGHDAGRAASGYDRYRSVFENSADGILLFHGDTGYVLEVNARAIEILGYSRQECQAFRLQDLPPFQPAAANRMIALLRRDGRLRCKERLAPKAGGMVECEILGSVYRDGSRRTVQLNIRDVTARRESEIEAMRMLASGVAHRFNNLLQSILGNASLLSDRLLPEAARIPYIGQVIAAANDGAELTRNLLISTGAAPFKPEPVDLSEAVGQVAGRFPSLIPPRVNVRLELSAKLPAVWADPKQVEQLVLCLVLNGAEAIEGKGTLHVRTGARTLAPGDLRELERPQCFASATCVCLEVEDTGCGIPDEVRPRIFDPFFTTKFLGRGLGLSVVMGIVTRHGGGIQVSSATQRGTIFRVFFPALDAIRSS